MLNFITAKKTGSYMSLLHLFRRVYQIRREMARMPLNRTRVRDIMLIWLDQNLLHFLNFKNWLWYYTFEFFKVCTKLAEMAILYWKDLTTAKKKTLHPVGLNLVQEIIAGLGVQCLTIWAKLACAI